MLRGITQSSVVRTARAVGERYALESGGYLSASIAFYGFLSLFPLMLLALSVAGFALADRPDLLEELTDRVAASVPGLEQLVGENLDRVVRTRTESGLIGLGTLLWTGTGVVGAARNGLARIHRRPVARGIGARALLIAQTAGLGALALVAAGATAWGSTLGAGGWAGAALRTAVFLGAAGLDFALFLLAFRFLLRDPPGWGPLVPGAIFAAIGWSALKIVGAWYGARVVGGATAVYGTFAAAVGVLLLLYLAARLFVYGAVLNAVLHERGGDEVATTDGDPVRPAERSTRELVRSIGNDAVALVRKEVELAKQEVREGIAARVGGMVAMAGAAIMILYLVGFGAAAGAVALGGVMPMWAALLVVAGGFLLLAVVALLVGRSLLKGPPIVPERARESVKEDVSWARAQLKR